MRVLNAKLSICLLLMFAKDRVLHQNKTKLSPFLTVLPLQPLPQLLCKAELLETCLYVSVSNASSVPLVQLLPLGVVLFPRATKVQSKGRLFSLSPHDLAAALALLTTCSSLKATTRDFLKREEKGNHYRVYMLPRKIVVSVVDICVLPIEICVVVKSLKSFAKLDRAWELRTWTAWFQMGQAGVPVVIVLPRSNLTSLGLLWKRIGITIS